MPLLFGSPHVEDGQQDVAVASLQSCAAQRWLDVAPNAQHHHVRHRADTARVARLLAGRGIGLVLSGGGARGFAHIGVLAELSSAGIEIDRIGSLINPVVEEEVSGPGSSFRLS